VSIKDVSSQLGGSLCSADILRTRGKGSSLDADVRTFWCKNLEYFEIYGVSARTRGVSAEKEEGGSIFRDFVRTSFMDGPK